MEYTSHYELIDVDSSAGNYDGTTLIPEGAIPLGTKVIIDEAFDGDATINVITTGDSPLVLQDETRNTPNIPYRMYDYSIPGYPPLTADNAGVVRVVVGGAPTVGKAKVYVTYLIEEV